MLTNEVKFFVLVRQNDSVYAAYLFIFEHHFCLAFWSDCED
jgi:hypothetical protein